MTRRTVPDAQAVTDSGVERDSGGNALIDLLTGADLRDTAKNRLVQKVLRQLIETYGFDRNDIRTGYRPTVQGRKQAAVDIVILRRAEEGAEQRVERVIVC